MVQVLPAKTNLGSQIGAGLGQGLAQGLSQGGEIGMQRGLLQAGLDKFRNMDRTQTTPFDLAANLIQATAGVPGAERYVGQLFPLLMSQLQGQTSSNTGNPSIAGTLGAPSNAPVSDIRKGLPSEANDPVTFLQSQQKQIPSSLPPLPSPSTQSSLFQGTLEPTSLGMGPVPAQYDENQIIQARNEDLSAGFPNSPRADTMEKYNQLAQQRVESMTRAAETQARIGGLAAQRQEDFRDILQNQLGIKNPSDLAVAEMIANEPDNKNIANDLIRAEKVKKKFDAYAASRDEFARASRRPNGFFQRELYNKSIENLKSKMEPFIKYGQRNEAIRILSGDEQNKGWSESEIAKITNPLSNDMKDQISELPSVSTSFAISPSGTPSQVTQKLRDKQIGIWEDYISKNLKPGKVDSRNPDTIQPGTSLILLRNEALRKGMSNADFDSMISSLLRQGKINLDPYQTKDLQMMSQSPSRVWSLYELLMGERK